MWPNLKKATLCGFEPATLKKKYICEYHLPSQLIALRGHLRLQEFVKTSYGLFSIFLFIDQSMVTRFTQHNTDKGQFNLSILHHCFQRLFLLFDYE